LAVLITLKFTNTVPELIKRALNIEQGWCTVEELSFNPRKIYFMLFTKKMMVRFVVNKAALGLVFSEYFGFPCQSYHQLFHHHNHPEPAQ
jgi:hypothetical protein